MAVTAYTNATVLLSGINLGAYSGEFTLDYKAEMLDATTFGLTSRKKLGGLTTGGITGKGFADTVVATEGAIATALGDDEVPITFFPFAITAGALDKNRGYAQPIGMATMTFGGPVGALLPVNFTAESGGDVVRAYCVKDFLSAANALTGSAAGTQYTLGQVSATQHLYAGLHITSVSAGASITVTILGGATTYITFTAMTAPGGQWATPVPGAIAETLWRANWVIAGGGPSIQGLVWVAIQ